MSSVIKSNAVVNLKAPPFHPNTQQGVAEKAKSPERVRLTGPVLAGALVDAARIRKDARVESRSMLVRSREEAERMLADARREAEQMRETAAREGKAAGYEQGLQEGRDEGLQQAENEMRPLVEQAQAVLHEALVQRETALARAEEDALKLALAVAEKIVRREVSLDEDVALRVIRTTLPRAEGSELIRIRVHPGEAGAVENQADMLRRLIDGASNFEILADASVTAGGCIIETDWGALDARLETRLREVSRELLDVMRNEG